MCAVRFSFDEKVVWARVIPFQISSKLYMRLDLHDRLDCINEYVFQKLQNLLVFYTFFAL